MGGRESRFRRAGRVSMSFASLSGCTNCLHAEGGLLEANELDVQGNKGTGTGITIAGGSPFELAGMRVSGFENGIVIKGGKGRIEKSDITGNAVGLSYLGSSAEILNNNIFDNREAEICAEKRLVIDRNYLGSEHHKDLKLKGDVLIASLLNAPYPKGRNVVLIERKDVTPELIAAQFEQNKAKGIEAFKNRKFGDAHQALRKALNQKEDRVVFLYLAYTQMILGDAAKSEKTLKNGIQAFPYEVRLYQVYARQLAAKGEKEQALKLVEKALRMNPDDATLKGPYEVPSKAERVSAPPETAVSSRNKKENFETLKTRGIDAFKNKAYTRAEKDLKDALSQKPDRNVYLYLIYTQMRLFKEEEILKTLEMSVRAFPNEIRFHRLYVKYLTDLGENEKALQKATEGLKQHPNDLQLKMLQELLQNKPNGNEK